MAALATPPPTSMGDDLGSILSDAFTEATSAPEDNSPVQTGADDIPGGEAPTSPETPGSPMPETPGGEGTSSYTLTEDGSSYLVPKSELPTLNGFKQYATEVQSIYPTVNDAKTAYQDAVDMRRMTTDFAHGTPEDLNAFLNYFAGTDFAQSDPNMAAAFKDAFIRMVPQAQEVLKNIAPEAAKSMTEGVINQRIEQAYETAKQYFDYAESTGFPDDMRYANTMLKQAQWLEWGANGKFRGTYDADKDQSSYDFKPVQVAQPEVSPREREFAAREEASFNRDYKNYNDNYVNGPMWKDYFADIDKALAPIKDRFNSEVFDALRENINKKLLNQMNTSDPEWARMNGIQRNTIAAQYKQLWQRGKTSKTMEPLVASYKASVLDRARRLLPSVVKPILETATANAVANSSKTARTAAPKNNPGTSRPAPPDQQRLVNGKPKPYRVQDDKEFNDIFAGI